MRVQHNIMAMNAYRNYTNNVSAMKKNLERLSSGYKINRAGDDAAGLAISEKMRAQITGLEVAQKNAKDGISLVQTAEGALTEVHDMLNRMVELASMSSNGTYDNTTDRVQLQKELDQLKDEINRIADSANFNGIKLLDGVSLGGDLSELGITYDSVSRVDGLTIGEVSNGGGTKGQFTIDIGNMFSEGDTIEIEIALPDGTSTTTVTYGYFKDPVAAAASTSFKGNTAEEQAKDLAAKLAIDGTIGANFDVTAEGSKIIITAKEEGTEKVATITKIGVTGGANVNLTSGSLDTASTPGKAGTADTAGEAYFELIGGGDSGGSMNIEAGDILTFTFNDASGNTLTVELKVDKAMIGINAAETTKNIVEALKEARFNDLDETTGIDESQLKVSDLFTLTENVKDSAGAVTANGTIYVKAAKGVSAGLATAVKVEVNRNGEKKEYDAVEVKEAAADSNWAKGVYELDGSSGTNFTYGDKIKLKGTLADGRAFEVELTAGVDFEIDESLAKTMTKLKDVLENSENVKVTITNNDDNKTTTTITARDLFGKTADGKGQGEFTITDDNSGKLTFTSRLKGTAGSLSGSELTALEVIPLKDASATLEREPAEAKTAAKSTIQVDSSLKYGSAIKVGDQVYEIVADARDVSSRKNNAVVVSDPTDAKAVAKALADAIQKNESGYTVKSNNDGLITVESNEIGSKQVALKVEFPYGDQVTSASFKFNPKAVKEGSILNFNGQKYEFVKTGNKPTNSDATAIEVDNFAKADAKDLAEAFKNVLNNGSAEIASDGTITLHGLEVDGDIENAKVLFENNLVLQIGDTADSWNQLKVNLLDCHVDAMGIGGISIADQESAQAAVDAIKEAINYVSDVRGTLGATQNRLDHTINNLSVMTENIQDAESTIRDTDIAEEMMAYTKNNILIQSAQAMLAQANQVPQGVLQLLQ